MNSDRLNAFTDGVLAIVITIMVLELKVPHDATRAALEPVLPLFGAYVLSFVMVGIFWNNHHHMLQSVSRIDGRVLWANHFLLFTLTLFPFVIRWIGEAGITALPVAAYGVVLTLSGIAYVLLEWALAGADPDSPVRAATRGHGKEIASLLLDLAAMPLAFVLPWISVAAYVVVAALWLIPDRRFERRAKA
ncbi:MAG: TMEM175 family protein [Pseudomonadota bacterium]|nr:TMEM175 family protein [Pseudomonadota bacterium]